MAANVVVIGNRRLVSHRDGQVTFRWRDYRQGQRSKLMTLKSTEFIPQFLLHLLPTGLMKIRHYGFNANCGRGTKLELSRWLLQVKQPPVASMPAATPNLSKQPNAIAHNAPLKLCPQCSLGYLQVIELLLPSYPDR